eukprot:Mrub_00829.p1 GENE.Mrub_00829~~Mrub_00829.p1  ORF type:complete len:503 (+),score=111.52 Mrub_00829:69-1511(+)
MEELHASRLPTGPTYTSLRGGYHHYNDLVFYKGLELELVAQLPRNDPLGTNSDHDPIIFRLKDVELKRGKLKMFPDKLKDEQILSRWKQAVQELNLPNYLGHYFTADKLYESINIACDLTQVRNPQYVFKKRARYTDTQLLEIRRLNGLIYAVQGDKRSRLRRRLNHYKYRRRQENWREFIRESIRGQQHWRLFRAMDRNNTILTKKKIPDNVLADRALYVQRWVDELTTIYSKKELPELPPELQDLANTNLDDIVDQAQDIQVDESDVKRALDKTKKSKSPGLNCINYKLLKYAFDADPEYFTLVCRHEINRTDSEDEFKRCRFVPIFKNKPGNDRSNPRHYRLISIMDCFQKILESIVVDKFANRLEDLAGKFQHGFIRNRGTHTAVNDYIRYSRTYRDREALQHVAFIDIEKAYPSVDLELMAKLCVIRLGNYKYFHKVRGLQNSTAFLDLGFQLVPIPIETSSRRTLNNPVSSSTL